jgi:hypothetical protein
VIIRELFVSDVTRDIPPVVYFHEQSPEKLASEVSEYIITGGWPDDHPNHRRVPDGIHEQYVKLLKAITAELEKPGGPELPAAWISGFYGSGKSSFAKLFGLALDGVALPGGSSLAEALLRRDLTPRADELRRAWNALRQKVEPLAVVFDIGGIARDNEHIHAAAVRQVQKRLGYCSTEPLVADFELKLERDNEWKRFEEAAAKVLGGPWSQRKDKQLAEDDFSLVLSNLYPDRYPEPMSWFMSRAGTGPKGESPEDAVAAAAQRSASRRKAAARSRRSVTRVCATCSKRSPTSAERPSSRRARTTWACRLVRESASSSSASSTARWSARTTQSPTPSLSSSLPRPSGSARYSSSSTSFPAPAPRGPS